MKQVTILFFLITCSALANQPAFADPPEGMTLVFSEDFTIRSAAGAVLIITACVMSLAGRVNGAKK